MFDMPKPRIGDIVLWYPYADVNREGTPAVVTGVAQMTITINVISKGAQTMPIRAPRHIDDPWLVGVRQSEDMDLKEAGCWDFLPQQKELVKTIKTLTEKVEALEAKEFPPAEKPQRRKEPVAL